MFRPIIRRSRIGRFLSSPRSLARLVPPHNSPRRLVLSSTWAIGRGRMLPASMVKGSDAALIAALPIVILIGPVVGFVSGAGIVLLGVSPIVMTLAGNGGLQGVALVYSNGTPDGFSSPLLRRFMTDREFLVTTVVIFVAIFVV